METYGKHRPTGFDPAGAFLPDRQQWLVVPVSRTRDSGPLDESNFAAAVEILGGESDSVEIHRFGHWGPGWYEIIIVDPASPAAVAAATDIEDRMADYPVLDEEDNSRREWEDFEQSWDDYGRRDFIKALVSAHDLSEEEEEKLDDMDSGDLQKFYMDNSNEPYFMDGDSVSIPVDRCNVDRDTLNDLLHPDPNANHPTLFNRESYPQR